MFGTSYRRDIVLYKSFYLYRKTRLSQGNRYLSFAAFESFFMSDGDYGGIRTYEEISEDADFEYPTKSKNIIK